MQNNSKLNEEIHMITYLYRLSYGFKFNLELICSSEFFKKLKLQGRLRQVQFRFLKNSQVQINSKLRDQPYDYLLININMKKIAWRMFELYKL